MVSRVEIINNIMKELVQFGAGINDPEIAGTLEQIYNRLDFAKKCLEDGVDSNNKKCTVRMVGLYILKCWRITAEPDFNKHLVKTIPRQYRRLLGMFNQIDKLASNTLSHEYKNLKKAEKQVGGIIPFLDKLEKNLGLAGEKELDPVKSEFFTTKSSDMKELASFLSDARDLQGSLVSQQEIVDKASNLWGDLEMIDWEEYYTGVDKHPIYVIKDLIRKYPELLENYMVKKFTPKKKSKKTGNEHKSAIIDKMKEDAVHLDFGKKKKHSQLFKKGEMDAKPSLPEDLLEKAKSRGNITHKGEKVPKEAVKFGPGKKDQKLPPIHQDPKSKSVDPKNSKKSISEQPEKTGQKAPSPKPVKPVATHTPEKEKETVSVKKQVKEAVSASPEPVKEKPGVKKTPTPSPEKQVKPKTEPEKPRSVQESTPKTKEYKEPEKPEKQPVTEAETPFSLGKGQDVFDIEGLKLKNPIIKPTEKGNKSESTQLLPQNEAEKTQILPPGTLQNLMEDQTDEIQILTAKRFPPPPKLGGKDRGRTWLGAAVKNGGIKPTPITVPAGMNDDLEEENEPEEIEEIKEDVLSASEGEKESKTGDEGETFPAGLHKETDLPPAEYTNEEKTKLISQMEDTGKMAKKKGCLPFVVGMGSFFILVIYGISKLF
ncbi:MAG: hypothetical protein K8T10_08390 [Candidatus Eremiobacteraeota bacterium]|nr:hypothetical protein [Candidatus Eremiobacteraeota bacterium]